MKCTISVTPDSKLPSAAKRTKVRKGPKVSPHAMEFNVRFAQWHSETCQSPPGPEAARWLRAPQPVVPGLELNSRKRLDAGDYHPEPGLCRLGQEKLRRGQQPQYVRGHGLDSRPRLDKHNFKIQL